MFQSAICKFTVKPSYIQKLTLFAATDDNKNLRDCFEIEWDGHADIVNYFTSHSLYEEYSILTFCDVLLLESPFHCFLDNDFLPNSKWAVLFKEETNTPMLINLNSGIDDENVYKLIEQCHDLWLTNIVRNV